ncbi:MAG TPA: TonB-dependent siderophore receptor [Thermoanaerobaculia bacterium]
MKTQLALTVVLAALAAGPLEAQAPASFVDTCRVDASQPEAKLSGRVHDPAGAPVGGASVTLSCGAFRRSVRTVGDGAYSFAAKAGTYQIDVEAPGFLPWAETVTLKAGGSERSLKLTEGRFSSIVTVSATGGYVAASSTTATKTEAPLIEIPQSVSVITSDQMAARNVQTVNETIQYTASVGVDTYGNEPRYDWINIRGFDQSTYGLFRDNSRWQAGQVSGQVDPYLIQEVDVVKGPSSVLYGQNTPGGLVNLVTKRPPAQTSNEAVVSLGSHSRKQVQLDLGGPLDAAGHWKYRLTGLYRDSDTQVDYVPDNRWFVAPAVTWSPSANTTWTVLADYQKDKTGWSQFLPSQGTLTSNPNGEIRRGLFTGEPDYDFFNRKQWSVGSLFEQRLSDVWTVRNTLRYSSIDYEGKTAFGGGLGADLRTLSRFGFGNTLSLRVFTVDTNASATFKTGTVEHAVLAGVDYSDSTSTIVSGFSFATPIDVFNPVYGAKVPDLFTYYDTKQPTSLLGVYAQDHMKIGKNVVATLSGRYDWTTMTTDDRIGKSSTDQSPNKFSGRAGLTYLFDFGLAPYASYSTSFLPTPGVNAYGQAYDPTTGKQIEAGLKFQPRNSNSFVTGSLFQITQTNVSVPDPANPVNTLQQGEIRSRGFELEAVASLTGGLSFHASYSYLNQEVTETTDPTTLGKRPPLAPKSLASAALEYTVPSGPLSGLGFGAGVRYVGTRAGDNTNTIEVPAYTLFDASTRYVWKSTELSLTATNVFDKTYVAVCTSVNYCNYGNAFRLIGSVRYRWQGW